MPHNYVVTLDGPAGVGKTSLAKRVAEHLGIAYLDTGAMFRAVGWIVGLEGLKMPEDRLEETFSRLSFSLEGKGALSRLLLNNEVLSEAIRTEAVGMAASTLGKLPQVRARLKKAQQELGASRSLVAEGRDMGTAVFPDARFKFFLEAAAEERARRRLLQLREMGQHAQYEPILNAIKIRDEQDRNRSIAPLKPAPDAIIINTTNLTLEEVFDAVIQGIEKRSAP
ncbi:MAG: (d)CMP kinase [Desulfovibrionales bacterium]